MAERERLHRERTRTASAASAALACVLAAAIWDAALAAPLTTWLGVLGLVLVARLAMARAHRHALRAGARPGSWLWRYRVAFVAHGLAWALVGFLVLPGASAEVTGLLAITYLAVTAGSLLGASFDVIAVALFVVPTLAPAVVPLYRGLAPASPAAGMVGLLFLAMAMHAAWRSQRSTRETVRLRLIEAAHAAQARQGEQRAETALHTYAAVSNSISEMVAVIDEKLAYRMVNDAWCRATGVARAAALGRHVFDVLPQADSPQRRLGIKECFEQQQPRAVRDAFTLPGLPERLGPVNTIAVHRRLARS